MTRKQIKELLEQLGGELKAEIEASQTSLKEARSITTKINNMLAKATDLIAKLEDSETGVDASLEKSTTNAEIISQHVTTSENAVVAIKDHLVDMAENIQAMEAEYTKFEATKAKIDDPTTGLEALLATARQLKGQVQASATQAATLEAKIGSDLSAVQQHIAAMQTAYTEFQKIKAQIDDEETGLEALLDSSQSLKDDLAAVSKERQTIYAEISRFKDQAAKNAASIQAIKEESDTALEQIKLHETESESTKNRISEIFELVSQSGHANYFDKRRRKLIIASILWLIAAVLALGIAIWMACALLLPIIDASAKDGNGVREAEIGVIILRAFIITPVVAFSIFAFSNYGKERRLAEQYAFKAVSASTYRGINRPYRAVTQISTKRTSEYSAG